MEQKQLVTFRLGGEYFGIQINQVAEIIEIENVTSVPEAGASLDGLIDLRGAVIPLVNLHRLLGLPQPESEAKMALIMNREESPVAIRVEEVSEIIQQNEGVHSQIPLHVKSRNREMYSGVVRYPSGEKEKLILVLNVDSIFTLNELRSLDQLSTTSKNQDSQSEEESKEARFETMILFEVQNNLFAIPSNSVVEIITPRAVTVVPGSKDEVEGMISLRKEIVPILNLRKRFHVEEKEEDSNTRIVVVEIENQKMGLLVDRVESVQNKWQEDLKEVPEFLEGINRDLLDGIFEEENGLSLVLNIKKLVLEEEPA